MMETWRVAVTTACVCGLFQVGTPDDLDGQSSPATPRPETIKLTYFGAAGWEITDGESVVLVDPYLSRSSYYPALPTDTLAPEEDLLQALVPRADYILVHHSHPDHIADVPFIALRTGATVIGTPSTANLMRAYGVPDRQIRTVRGGEDMELGDISVRVIPALHGPYASTEVIPDTITRPVRVWSLSPDGGPLMFLVRFGDRQVLTMGSMAYIEREVEGLRPEVAVVGASRARRLIYEYTPRLLRALGHPPVVLPTHWDNFTVPYGYPQPDYTTSSLREFVQEVSAASPETDVVIPEHLVSISVGSDGTIRRERTKVRVEDWDLIPTIPPGSNPLSHFNGGELDASFGLGWVTYADGTYGGESVSHVQIASDGAEGSPGSLLVSGAVVDNPNPYAGAIFFPGERAAQAVDFSDYDELTFWAKGDGRSYQLQVWSLSTWPDYVTLSFEAAPEWRQYAFPLSSFGDVSDNLTTMFFFASDVRGPFWFQIDELRVR